MIVCKVPDELAEKLQAKTPNEFLAAVISLLEKPEPKAEEANPTVEATELLFDAITDAKADILKAIANGPKVDAEALAKIARNEASKVTAEALASVGTNPAPAPKTVDNPANSTSIAADDYEGQWKASEQLRGEFAGDFKAYLSYAKALSAGRTRAFQPGKKS